MMEDWRDVVGWEGIYQVSDQGRVRRIKQGPGTKTGVLKASVSGNGYPMVSLCYDGRINKRTVHSLVAQAFFGPPPVGQEVNHKNTNRDDARLENLEYQV